MDKLQICNVLKEISDKGVFFGASFYLNGEYPLTPEQVVEYVDDPIGFEAKLNNIPQNNLVYLIELYKNGGFPPQCRGVTKKGKRCKNYALECWSHMYYKPEEEEYCYLHHPSIGK